MTAAAARIPIIEKTVDELWDEHEAHRLKAAEETEAKGVIEMELLRRAKVQRPDFEPDTGGSVELVGDRYVLAVTYDRSYEYFPAVIDELPALTLDGETGPASLTAAEYRDLVEWVPKVNGNVFNKFLKRGGVLGEVLARMRTLKPDARPKFTPKARSN